MPSWNIHCRISVPQIPLPDFMLKESNFHERTFIEKCKPFDSNKFRVNCLILSMYRSVFEKRGRGFGGDTRHKSLQ